MTSIRFICIDRNDVSTLTSVLPKLRAAGAKVSFVTGYLGPVEERQIPEVPILRPPAPLASDVLSTTQRRLVKETGDPEDLVYAASWVRSFPEFLARSISENRADLVVLPPPDIEPSIAARVCERLGARYVCLFPQYYEFKYDALLGTYDNAEAYLVAGDFGRRRLRARGVPEERIRVVGNPRYDAALSRARGDAPSSGEPRTILCTAQALPENARLFERLCRYVTARDGVRLVLRTHPQAGRGGGEDIGMYEAIRRRVALDKPVAVAPPGTLAEHLADAGVLVTLTSNTILDALLAGVPAVMWSTDGLPARVPFGVEGDAKIARDYGELESALDALLFDREHRRKWIAGRAGAHVRYLGAGAAADSLATTLLELARRVTRCQA